MSHIPPVAPRDASVLARTAYRAAARRVGEVPEPFAVLAHQPRVIFASLAHELAVEKGVDDASAVLEWSS